MGIIFAWSVIKANKAVIIRALVWMIAWCNFISISAGLY